MENNEKKPFATPRQIALGSFLLCFGVMCIGAIIGEAFGIDSHIVILFAGIVGVFLYKREAPLDLAKQIRTYDVKIPLMLTILNFTCCEFFSSLFGFIASNFMEVKPSHTHEITVISVIMSVIVASVSEELIFRLCGVGILKKHYSKTFTILFTTLIFALIHLYNIQGTIDVFVGTIWFALCYYYTENILYTITAHSLHNLLCVPDFSALYNTVNGFQILHIQWFILMAIIFAVSVVWFVKTFGKEEYKERQLA